MTRISQKLEALVLWLHQFFPGRWAGVTREYRFMVKSCPLALADLAQRCHAFEDCYVPDASDAETYMAIGRRQVWLHITEMANVDDNDLTPIMEELTNATRSSTGHRRPNDDTSDPAGW